jgi:hypothetical protein
LFIVAGMQQVLTHGEQGLRWRDPHAGDDVLPPGGPVAFD